MELIPVDDPEGKITFVHPRDSQAIRRLESLGAWPQKEVLPPVFHNLSESSLAVRRWEVQEDMRESLAEGAD